MGDQGIYDRLADYLNTMPVGAPKTPELIEILKTLYTEKEAELAVKLPFLPMTVDALSDRTGVKEADLKPMLEKMAKKGIVFVELGADEPMYRLLPTVVGFSETPFWPGKRTPETEKLAPLWLKYVRDAFYHEIGGLSETPMTRVIPVQESIVDDRRIAPYERLVEKVKETSYQAVAHCPCRLMRDYSGEGRCEHSTENCLHFGSLGRYIVAQGMAREITIDETLGILKKSNEEGLVHITANHQGEIDTICNCCADACIFLTGLMVQGEKNMFARSNFVSEINQETCAECGTCAERCPVEAISVDDGPATVEPDKCIGCGVCYPTCPSESVSLVARPEADRVEVMEPGALVTKVMNDKGRQFRF
ncbi:MAG: 4Fe-4S binding protein [Candidatus Hydrogenedentota bacterium]|nr:MAG: 4Fe-4S binding protein [Candidatus Hydrogenedentota bacterium]